MIPSSIFRSFSPSSFPLLSSGVYSLLFKSSSSSPTSSSISSPFFPSSLPSLPVSPPSPSPLPLVLSRPFHPSPPLSFPTMDIAKSLRVPNWFHLPPPANAPNAPLRIYKVQSFFVVMRGRGGTTIKFKLEDWKTGRVGLEVTLGPEDVVWIYSKAEVQEMMEEKEGKGKEGERKMEKEKEEDRGEEDNVREKEVFPEDIKESKVMSFLYYDPKSRVFHFMDSTNYDQIDIKEDENFHISFDGDMMKTWSENKEVEFLYGEDKKLLGIRDKIAS